MPADPTQASAPTRAERLADALEELVGLGMVVARTVSAAAQPASPDSSAPDPVKLADAFDRVSRAIRRTVRLIEHLETARRTPSQHRAASKRRVLRDVEDAIESHQTSRANKEALNDELLERLDGIDVIEDIDADRPIAEIVGEICRDLGVAAPPGFSPWKRRTPDDIADLVARAAANDHPHAAHWPPHQPEPKPGQANGPNPPHPSPRHASGLPP